MCRNFGHFRNSSRMDSQRSQILLKDKGNPTKVNCPKTKSCLDAYRDDACGTLFCCVDNFFGKWSVIDESRTGTFLHDTRCGTSHIQVNAIKAHVDQFFGCFVEVFRTSSPYLRNNGPFDFSIFKPLINKSFSL